MKFNTNKYYEIKLPSHRINFKVIVLIISLSVIDLFYSTYLYDDCCFDLIDGVFMGLLATCATSSIIVAKKYRGSDMFAKAYLFLGLGFYAWFAGDIIFYYYWFVLDLFPYPSPADFFFIANYVFAILHLYLNTRYFKPKWTAELKSLVIIIPIASVSLFTIFAYNMWGVYDDLAFDLLYGNIFVVGISLTFALAAVGVIIFRESILKETWLLLAIGILLWAIGDSVFVYLETIEAFTHNHPINTIWVASFMIIIYALYKHHKTI